MSEKARLDGRTARHNLLFIAGERYGVFPSSRTAGSKERRLMRAMQDASDAIPPVSREEIIAIVEDAKQTSFIIDSERNNLVGRRLPNLTTGEPL